MLGAVPLAIGFGEGAELRRPLGITIVGGLLVSQVLTLFRPHAIEQRRISLLICYRSGCR